MMIGEIDGRPTKSNTNGSPHAVTDVTKMFNGGDISSSYAGLMDAMPIP
ncbi:MAG: hypothetical protein ACW985_08515 [Candidatus Thorarchaeota archaeon]